CSSSEIETARGSKNTVAVRSKVTPCFRALMSAFLGSQSKVYSTSSGVSNSRDDRFLAHLAAPLLDYRLPRHPAGNLLEHIRDQDPPPAQGRRSLAYPLVDDDIAAGCPSFCLHLSTPAYVTIRLSAMDFDVDRRTR